MVRHQKIVCSACRRKKSKCDGASPTCSACIASGSTCHYEKAPSIAYVRTLQARIRELEGNQKSVNSPSSPSFVGSTFSTQGGDSISLDARGDVSYHNETSAIHEDVPPTPTQSMHDGSLFAATAAEERYASETRDRLVANAATQKRLETANLEASYSLAHLPTELTSTLLQLHWCWLHPSFLFVYRPTFTRDMPLLAQGDRSAPYCSLTLLKVLYAHSCRFIRAPETIWRPQSGGETFDQFTERLMSEAKTLLAMETLNPPSIPTIQALLQQSARDIACGRSSSAWLYSGMAFRMAIDLGLHVSPDKLQKYCTSLSAEDIEIRKRLFWSLFAWDKHISLYLGRMPNFVLGSENVSLNFLDDFTDSDPWVPFYGSDPKASGLPHYPPTPGRIISCFKELCNLCKILTRMMLELYSSQSTDQQSSPSGSQAAAFVEIKKQLDDWYSSLPSYLRVDPGNIPQLSPPPHITSLNLMYHNSLILLHRPLVASGQGPRSGAIEQSWRTCRSATTAIYDLLKMYIATFGFHHITYMNSYCTYTAATTAVYQLEISEDTSQSSQLNQAAWTELKFLLDILQHTATAMPGLNRSIDIIRTRIKRILDRQVSKQLDSLFPMKMGSADDRNTQPAGSVSALNQMDNEKVSSNIQLDCSPAGPLHDWDASRDTLTENPNGWNIWLPAFPGQDISYGPEVMLDQDALSPQTRSALMGSNLDPQLQLNLPLAGGSTWGYSPLSNP